MDWKRVRMEKLDCTELERNKEKKYNERETSNNQKEITHTHGISE